MSIEQWVWVAVALAALCVGMVLALFGIRLGSRGDGRPYSADEAINYALMIEDEHVLRAYLMAWNEGDWNGAELILREHVFRAELLGQR